MEHPSKQPPLEPWECEWIDHQARWTLELVGQPGVFNDLCIMDAFDWDHAGTVEWLRIIDEGRSQ